MTSQIQNRRKSLLEAQHDLESQVETRTLELKKRGEELEKAVKHLSEIDASRARFLADISHELRTPLTILRGQSEVTLRASHNDPERLRQALTLVARKAEQMGLLVDDILFLARSEAGTFIVKLDPVVLQDVVTDVLFDSQRVSICLKQPAEPIIIKGDESRLRQALLIPLDNAIRLTPAGTEIDVEISVDSERAIFVVTDEGSGFTPEEAKRAFVRFFQGSASRGRAGRNTGLGLSIAHWIIEQHGGTIHIECLPNKGASVRIELPLLKEFIA